MCRKEDLENKYIRDQLKYGNRPQSQQNNSDTEEESDNAEVFERITRRMTQDPIKINKNDC